MKHVAGILTTIHAAGLVSSLALVALPARGETIVPATNLRIETPASARIEAIERKLEHKPTDSDALADLAIAYVRRARETADPAFYQAAHRAIDASLHARPAYERANRARVAVLLGQHRFGAAAELAESLAGPQTRDATLLGYLFDAYLELGRYDEGWEVLPRMLEFSPGSPAVLARASYLVELSGDLGGAARLMERALAATPGLEREDRAWLLTHLAHLDRQLGELERARRRLDAALALFPDYHYAIAEHARVAGAAGDAAAAARWAGRRCDLAPHPECFYDLALALENAGQPERAKSAFGRFAATAPAESDFEDNANRELIRYYLDQAGRPAEALRLAALERSRRADVFTRTLYALALAANGRHEDARVEIDAVCEVGTVDPWIAEKRSRVLGIVGR